MTAEPNGMRATPHAELIARLMDSRIAKSEIEWAARREIEALKARAERAEAENARLREAHEANAAEVYTDRGSVTPETAWEAWRQMNALAVRMAKRSADALAGAGEKREMTYTDIGKLPIKNVE